MTDSLEPADNEDQQKRIILHDDRAETKQDIKNYSAERIIQAYIEALNLLAS